MRYLFLSVCAALCAVSLSPQALGAFSEKRELRRAAIVDVKENIKRLKKINMMIKKVRDEKTAAKFLPTLVDMYDAVDMSSMETAMGTAVTQDEADTPDYAAELAVRRKDYNRLLESIVSEKERIVGLGLKNKLVSELSDRIDQAEKERKEHEVFMKEHEAKEAAGGKAAEKKTAPAPAPAGGNSIDVGEVEELF